MNTLEFTRFKELSYACSEAINTLCTNLTFMGEGKKKIMVTSCTAHEGKSFITINLMRTFARLGHKVLLIDADLRRSQITSKYGVRFAESEKFGLSHYLAGMKTLDEVIYKTDIPGAYMIPVGRSVINSLALLNTARFGRMIGRLESEFDFILLDAPPVGAIIDAAEIAKHCDGTLFVVKYNMISGKDLREAKLQIERTGCEILGAVINDVEFNTLSSKRYYNKSYYTHYDSDYYKPRAKKRKADQDK